MRVAIYHGTELDHLCCWGGQTIRQMMKVMNKNGIRNIPVIKKDTKTFVGIVTDGDIRRYLANGGELEDEVSVVTNHNPVLVSKRMRPHDIKTFMLTNSIECLPLVIDGKLEELYVLWAINISSGLTAVIMVGGLGSRLAPLTDNCPKPMLQLGGKPILTHILEHLKSEGIHKAVLCLNYLGQMIEDYYGDGSSLGMEIQYVREIGRLGTGGALHLLDIDQISEPFLCMNGDLLNDLEVEKLQTKQFSNSWDATMVVRDFHYQMEYGVVKRNEQGDFLGSDEKPNVTFSINAGMYLLSKSVLSIIPKGEFFDLPNLFEMLKSRNMRCGTFLHAGRWIDIGTLAEFERAKELYER